MEVNIGQRGQGGPGLIYTVVLRVHGIHCP